jgi:plasmid stabilization system protein ParE
VGYKIIIKKRFANNLLNVLTYLEQEFGKKVADEFHDKITRALDLLKSYPYIGAPSIKLKGARGILITPYNRLFYRIENNKIIIISLVDTRRKNYH